MVCLQGKSCVIHISERFSNDAFHLRRYTNGIPLPFLSAATTRSNRWPNSVVNKSTSHMLKQAVTHQCQFTASIDGVLEVAAAVSMPCCRTRRRPGGGGRVLLQHLSSFIWKFNNGKWWRGHACASCSSIVRETDGLSSYCWPLTSDQCGCVACVTRPTPVAAADAVASVLNRIDRKCLMVRGVRRVTSGQTNDCPLLLSTDLQLWSRAVPWRPDV